MASGCVPGSGGRRAGSGQKKSIDLMRCRQVSET